MQEVEMIQVLQDQLLSIIISFFVIIDCQREVFSLMNFLFLLPLELRIATSQSSWQFDSDRSRGQKSPNIDFKLQNSSHDAMGSDLNHISRQDACTKQ